VLLCFVQEQIYTSTDISLLLQAIHSAQDVINKIKDMRKGMMGSALISIMNEVRTALKQTAQSENMNWKTGGMEDDWGAGIAQWLECRTRDRKVVGSNPCRSGW